MQKKNTGCRVKGLLKRASYSNGPFLNFAPDFFGRRGKQTKIKSVLRKWTSCLETKKAVFATAFFMCYFYFFGFIVGNKITSRNVCASQRSAMNLSMPMPKPAAGGMPY